jgi:hypothetical protein
MRSLGVPSDEGDAVREDTGCGVGKRCARQEGMVEMRNEFQNSKSQRKEGENHE